MPDQNSYCCDMRKKVILGIDKVLSEEECGVPDSAMVDFHEFSYESPTGLPVSAALVTKYCAWCGTKHGPDIERRTSEAIRPHQ